MTALNKQALIAKIKKQTESFDTVVLKEDEANAMLDELEAAEKRIAELEARTITVEFEPLPMEELGNRRDGKKHPYMFGAGYNSAVVHCESVLHQACAAAGISIKGSE